MKAPSINPVRCAIYTRVWTEHGLDPGSKNKSKTQISCYMPMPSNSSATIANCACCAAGSAITSSVSYRQPSKNWRLPSGHLANASISRKWSR